MLKALNVHSYTADVIVAFFMSGHASLTRVLLVLLVLAHPGVLIYSLMEHLF